MIASHLGYVKICQLLLRHGAYIDSKDLVWECLSRLECILKVDVVCYTQVGYTALIWGVNANKPNIVELLLQKGANIETVDKDGRSALLIAVGKGHARVVELLLEEGADIHVTDNVSCSHSLNTFMYNSSRNSFVLFIFPVRENWMSLKFQIPWIKQFYSPIRLPFCRM